MTQRSHHKKGKRFNTSPPFTPTRGKRIMDQFKCVVSKIGEKLAGISCCEVDENKFPLAFKKDLSSRWRAE